MMLHPFRKLFAGATNTPLACTLMGIELFGAENAIYYGVACCTAYYFSGHSGIYVSQRVAVSKIHTAKFQSKPYRITGIRKKDGDNLSPEN